MNKLKEIRLNYNYTQQRFAEKLGVSQQLIALWENGKNDPALESLKKIKKGLEEIRKEHGERNAAKLTLDELLDEL